MYNVSEQFIAAIKNNARYIKCYFVFDGAEYNPITVTIDNNIYSSDKDAFIGTFIGKSGSIKVRANDNLDLENKDLRLYFGIVLENDTIEYVPQGSFRVYEKTSNTEYKICDHKIFFNEKINTNEIPYPTTPERLAQWVGEKLNIEVIIPTDFPNRNLTIPSEIFFGYDATYANVVEAIAQATCTFAQINRSGQLEFKWFKKVDFSIDIENLPKGYPALSKVLDPINSIVLAREPQNDNIYWPETVEEDRSEYKVINNPILDVDRYTSRMEIYDRMNGFSYIPVSVATQGFFHVDSGDIVSLQIKDGSYIDMLIMNHTLKYNGGISSQFETPALSKTMIDYSIASSIESHIYRTELEVDKVKNEIVAVVEKVDTVSGENVSVVEQTNELKMTVNELKNQITTTGGNNLIKDSLGVFGGSWVSENDTKYSLNTSIDVRRRNLTGIAILLNADTITQTIQLPDGEYTLSFSYCKHVSLASVKIIVDTEEFELRNLDYTQFKHTFSVTGSVQIQFVSDTKDSCTIVNIMLNQGSVASVWSLSQGESYSANFQISKDGATVSSSTSDVIFNMKNDIVGFKNKNTDEYITNFTDVGIDVKEITVTGKARILGLLFQEINGQIVVNKLGRW